MGSYSNTETVVTPWNYSNGRPKWVAIDRCVLKEVQWLWANGVRTLESCCGHGQVDGYIAVYPEYIRRMHELGYLAQVSRPDIFHTRGGTPRTPCMAPPSLIA